MNRRRISVALVAYAGMAVVAFGLGAWQGRALPVRHPAPWLDLGRWAEAVSFGLGVVIAVATVASTRALVARTEWARALRTEFRAVLAGASGAQLAALGLASGVVEELLFRGAVQPVAGLVPTAILFGLVHVGPTRAFRSWTAWALAMGLVLGAAFEATGSLLGPIVAHVAINVVNLRMIALHDARIDEGDGRMKPPRLVPPRARR